MTLKGQQFLSNFSLPNFYFHAAIAHGILRHNGVEIGKRDFLGRELTASVIPGRPQRDSDPTPRDDLRFASLGIARMRCFAIAPTTPASRHYVARLISMIILRQRIRVPRRPPYGGSCAASLQAEWLRHCASAAMHNCSHRHFPETLP